MKSKPRRKDWQGGQEKDLDALADGTRAQDREVVRRKMGADHDSTDVYSRQRVNQVIAEMKMKLGFSLDLIVLGPDGKH